MPLTGISDYDQVVLESHFPIGWLAPKYITAENADEVSSIEATNNSTLSPLLGEATLTPAGPDYGFTLGPLMRLYCSNLNECRGLAFLGSDDLRHGLAW